jgi:predicted DNA-binding protein (UPF0251 family)
MPYKEEGNKNYDIKRLWGQQKEILRLIASGLYNNKQVAEFVGVTPQTVSNVINSALGKQALEMMEGAADSETVDLMVRIRALAPIALTVEEELMLDTETSGRLKHDIAGKVLDRAGYAPISKNLNLNMNAGLKREDIDAIKLRAKQLQEVEMADFVEEKEEPAKAAKEAS